MSRSLLAATVAILLSVPSSGRAAKVKVWHHHTPAHHEQAEFKHAVVSSEGALRLARQLKPLARLETTHVWDVHEDSQGNLFVATGDEGKVFKVSPEGKASLVFTSQDSQVFCLTTAPDGTLYAGTGPSGLIIRITHDGQAEVICHGPETYVWCLAYDAKRQLLYAGTGPKGRIYRLAPDGKAELFYSTKQEHILCLAVGPDGMLYAGTDKRGLVYRIDDKGKGFVLFHAPQTEIRSLLVTPDGVYAATSSPARRRSSAGSSGSTSRVSTSSSSSAAVPVADTKSKDEKSKDDSPKAEKPKEDKPGADNTVESIRSKSTSSTEAEKSSSAPAPAPPGSGENSLYRIAPDGTVREIFRAKTLFLSLVRQQGRILVGTGMEGQLFEVHEATKEYSEIARLDHGQIHCLCRRHDGSIVLGTGDPGKLYVLHDRYAAKGTVTSEVLDAKLISKWGSLRWQADAPLGTSVTVAVRSGNVAEPDETWSDWSAEQADPQQAFIAAPTARFLQYRVALATRNPALTPAVHSIALRYMTTNQAPEVTEVEVPNLDAVNLDNPKKLRIKWSATDANEDDLTYSLLVRKEGWKSWVELEEGLDKKEFEWDTTTTPSGIYRIKVVANDRKDNPAEDALSGECITGPLVVSHTPPVVSLKVLGIEGEQAIFEATAVGPLIRLTAASFAVNGKKWMNVFPTDGLFDSKSETFRFKTEALKPGTYVLVLRVRDAAGNSGSADVVFTVQTRTTER